MQVNRKAKEQLSHLRRAICFDDDANFVHAAATVNQTVKSCAEAAEHCDHPEWGEGIIFFCPETCGACGDCTDNDDKLISVAKEFNMTLTGCSDMEVVNHCGDPKYGHGLAHLCPETCGACVCDDDDDSFLMAAAEHFPELTGCSDVKDHCEDPKYGFGIAHYCPATCGLCSPGSKPGPGRGGRGHGSRGEGEGEGRGGGRGGGRGYGDGEGHLPHPSAAP